MKKLIVMMMLAVLVVGCSQKQKSPVEARFERYVQSENLTDNISRVDSIVLVDSITIIKQLEWIDNMSDSLDNCVLESIKLMADAKYIYNEARAIEAADIALRYTNIVSGNRKEKADGLKDKILVFVDDNKENKCYYLEHKIYVTTPEGHDIYNSRTIGYEDSIIIYKDPKQAWTTKSSRIGTYLRDYMTETVASKMVLMDEINTFLGK